MLDPDFVTAPVPEMDPENVTVSLRLKVSCPLLTTLPGTAPAAAPTPTVRPPPEIVVKPPYELSPVRVSVPSPCFVKAPVPDTTPPYVRSVERLNRSVALLVTFPAIDPVAPPSPTESVPAEMVVPPVKVFVADNVSTLAAFIVNDPLPEIAPPRVWFALGAIASDVDVARLIAPP